MQGGSTMRILKSVIVMLLLLCLLSACSTSKNEESSNTGSFSLDSVSSFDGKYTANIETNGTMISIHISENGTDIFSFDPVRKTDFWGICWERDTYNLWIQSGDVGVICYQYEEGVWRFNSDAVCPEYIESKYD
jgi:hypothetical protein